MDKAYSRIVWQNQPSTATALGATNLNKVDVALNSIDDRVVGMDTSKANQSTVNNVVQSITFNSANGVLTVTKVNGTTATIDTKLEKLAVNFSYNPSTQQLDITLDDGTVQHVDMSALVTQYEFDNTGTIAFTLTGGRITANVVNGSITAEKLHPDYLANLTVQAQIAEENKNIAIAQAGIATDAADDAETYRDQALQYRNEAEGIVGVGIATESVPGLVKGAGNVSVRTNGDMWADPYKDKGTITGPSVQFPAADNGLIEITSIIGKSSVIPADPLQPISPDNIATIHNVGDVPFNVGACGKNWLNYMDSESGILSTTTGEPAASSSWRKTINYYKILGSATYTLSQEFSQYFQFIIVFYDNQKNFISSIYLNEEAKLSKSISTPANAQYYKISWSISVSGSAVDRGKLQIEPGNTATPYEPYKGNQTPVSDTYGALPDGTYDERTPDKDIKRKRRVILTGTGPGIVLAETLTNTLRFIINNVMVDRADNDTLMVCTHFDCRVRGNTADNEHIRNSAAGLQNAQMLVIYINKSRLATQDVAGFRTWLASQYAANTPVTIDYPLDTPIESPRDRIFATSYPGITNVYTTDPLQPTFTAVAKSELRSNQILIDIGIKTLQDGKIDKTVIEKVDNRLISIKETDDFGTDYSMYENASNTVDSTATVNTTNKTLTIAKGVYFSNSYKAHKLMTYGRNAIINTVFSPSNQYPQIGLRCNAKDCIGALVWYLNATMNGMNLLRVNDNAGGSSQIYPGPVHDGNTTDDIEMSVRSFENMTECFFKQNGRVIATGRYIGSDFNNLKGTANGLGANGTAIYKKYLKAMELRNYINIICLGDSNTAGNGLTLKNTYPALLQSRLFEYNAGVVNKGVSADRITNVVSRLSNDVYGQKVTNARNIVMLQIGTNDATDGMSATNIYNNIVNNLVNPMKQNGFEVWLSTIPVRDNNSGARVIIKDVNNLILQDTNADKIIDLYNRMVDSSDITIPGLLQADNLHLTEKATNILAALISNELK